MSNESTKIRKSSKITWILPSMNYEASKCIVGFNIFEQKSHISLLVSNSATKCLLQIVNDNTISGDNYVQYSI